MPHCESVSSLNSNYQNKRNSLDNCDLSELYM